MLTVLTFTFNAIANFALGLGIAYFLGAQEFGSFALAVAAGSVLQTLFFEWLRLAANRFYGEKQGADDPGVLATLNFANGVIAIIMSALALALHFNGGAFGVTAMIAAMAPLIAISGGLLDYRAALARARFQNRRYAQLVIVKNAVALVLMLGGAWYWKRADYVLIGLCISALSGVIVTARSFREGGRAAEVRRDLIRRFALYSAPLIVSSMFFQVNMFMARSGVALHYGIAESGRYSLALDIGLKLVGTIGSALDILLFQLAVRAEAEHGVEAAKEQLGRNVLIIIAVVLPACLGYWMVLPSFEGLFVGQSYQGAFHDYSVLLLPGLFAYALVHYVVNPLFQIARKTAPVIVAALANFAVTAFVLFVLPGSNGGQGAIATSAGFITGAVLMSLLAWRVAPVRVQWGELLKVAIAALGMCAVLWLFRGVAPGVVTLIVMAASGGVAYLALCVALDVGGLRARIMQKLRPARA